jgi:hypothetical protein
MFRIIRSNNIATKDYMQSSPTIKAITSNFVVREPWPPPPRLFSCTTTFDSKVIFFLNNASPTMTTSYYTRVKFFVFEAFNIRLEFSSNPQNLQNNQKCFAIMFLLSNIDTKFQSIPWSKFPKSKQTCTFQVVLFTFKGPNTPWSKLTTMKQMLLSLQPKNFNQGWTHIFHDETNIFEVRTKTTYF